MLFDVECVQEAEISISIDSITAKLNYSVQNQICFKMKYLYERKKSETEFTTPVKGENEVKGNKTIYNWKPENQENPLTFNKIMLSVNELTCSNIEILFYEMSVAENEENNIKNDDLFDKDNRELKSPIESKGTYFMKIPKSTTSLKKDLKSKTMKVKNVDDDDFVILLPNLEIGYSRISLYNILSEKTMFLHFQMSNCFHLFNYLYKEAFQEKIIDLNLSGQNLTPKNSKLDLGIEKVSSHRSEINFGKILSNANYKEKENDMKKKDNKKLSNNVVLKIFDERLPIKYKETIYHDGKVIGEIEGNITIKHIPLLKQVLCGCHTEKGLDLNTNYYNISSLSEAKNKNELPKELKYIESQNGELTQSILNFTLKQNSFSYKELNNHLTEVLKTFIIPLNYKDKEGHYRYEIKTEYGRLKAPEILLNVGLTIINSMDGFNKEQRQICFEILNLINLRGELTLKSLSLFTNLGKNEEQNKLQIKVIELFLEFMVKLLDNTLQKFNRKFNDDQTKQFISIVLATAYFRIPLFQFEFLKTLNPNYKISKTEIILMGSYNYIFDWSELFYNKIARIKEIHFEEKSKKLKEVLNDCNWRQRISLKGLGFYNIIEQFEPYLLTKFEKNEDVTLEKVPGISVIKDSITEDLQSKPIYSYSTSLIKLLGIFIYNPNDVNAFYKIIINRTNAYDSPSVFMVVKILDFFFTTSEKNEITSSFGYKFDFNLLKAPFSIILEIDNALCIAKYLWLYYKNAEKMSIIHLSEVLTDIFQNRFFNLFFHWSWQVREIFYHLLLYTVSYKLKSKNYLKQRKSMIEERINALKKNDEEGFYKSFHTNYYEQMKSKIITDYYEKARSIEVIRSTLRKEKIEQMYNEIFIFEAKGLEGLTKENRKVVLDSMLQFEKIEKDFKKWEKENRNIPEPKLPEIDIKPPKDDYTEYSTSNFEKW